ncbi:MAG TPA: pitrilysin family protein [Gemmatimonadales bacterium]|jgi:zinc protease
MRPTGGLFREQLPNGLTLLIQQRHSVPAAALVTHVRAGFLDEPDALQGASHVLEHMLFKGTPSLGPGELAQRTKALGGTLNAYTSYDRTVYYASAPSRHLADLAALQADQVQHALIDPDELRRELGVIIQEARRKLDSPGAVAGETLHDLLYDRHRIRRWRIGTEAALEGFTRDDIAGYYHSRYVPSRVIVALVSDIDPLDAAAMLRAEWGDWTGAPPEIPPGPVENHAAVLRARRMSGDVARSELVLGWRGPGELHDDVPALDVAAAILGTGRGSRFAKALREPGLVTDVGVSSYGVIDTGVFSIGAELDAAVLDDVLAVVAGAVTDLTRDIPSDGELARAVTLLRAGTARRLDRYESRAIALADAEALGDVRRLDGEIGRLLAVTPDAVRAAAQRWLRLDELSAVAYLPSASEVPFDVATLQNAMASARSGSSAVIATALPPERVVVPEIITRAGAPARLSVHHLVAGSCDILTASFGDSGQTSLAIYRARRQPEGPDNAGLGALAIRSMLRGTQRFDAAHLAFAMESLGGGVGPSLSADLIGFHANVLSEHAGTAASLLAEVLFAPRLDTGAITIERQQLRDDAHAVADDMVRFPMQLALGVAFNDHGYGAPTLGTDASIDRLDAAAIRQWHQAAIRGGRTTIVGVGDGNAEQLAQAIAAATSTWCGQGDGAAVVADHTSIAVQAGVRRDGRDRQQSALAMLFPGPTRHDANRFAAEVWSGIAGGLGGRLFESLRSARSLAYTVMASSWQRRRAGGLLTYIAMDPDRLDEARDAMLEELAAFRAEPPTAEEVTRSRAMLMGEIEMARQTPGAVAGEIADAWLLGDGLADLEDPMAPYAGVTAEAVHAVAAQYLDPDRRAEGIVAASRAE